MIMNGTYVEAADEFWTLSHESSPRRAVWAKGVL